MSGETKEYILILEIHPEYLVHGPSLININNAQQCKTRLNENRLRMQIECDVFDGMSAIPQAAKTNNIWNLVERAWQIKIYVQKLQFLDIYGV